MFTLTHATPTTDFAAVAQLYYDTWQVAYRGLIPQAFLDGLTPATWHPERRQANTLLAWQAQRLIGVCSYGPARDAHYAGWGEVYSLYVHPDFHRLGCGKALLEAALAILTPEYARQYLVVLRHNEPAQALYRRAGFAASADVRVEAGGFEEVVFCRTNPSTKNAPLQQS